MFTYLSEQLKEITTPENLLRIVKITGFAILGYILLRIIRRIVSKLIRKRVSQQIAMLVTKSITYLGMLIIILTILHELGLDLGIILGTAGVAGIALGFASQTVLSNFISGLFLITEKPFEIGDAVKVGERVGQVASIDLLSVKIRTFDNQYVRIPNEFIIKNDITNITRYPIRRLDINVSIAYKEKPEIVQEVLLEIARVNQYCLNNPEPFFLIKEFGPNGVDILFGVWFSKTDYVQVKNGVMMEIKNRFEERGIEIPLPHISIYSGSETEPFPLSINPVNTESPG